MVALARRCSGQPPHWGTAQAPHPTSLSAHVGGKISPWAHRYDEQAGGHHNFQLCILVVSCLRMICSTSRAELNRLVVFGWRSVEVVREVIVGVLPNTAEVFFERKTQLKFGPHFSTWAYI